jgi:hypothetical protein
MHTSTWSNKSVYKTSEVGNVKKILANRPKEISDEDWKEIVKEAKMNKLIMLNEVPKASKKSGAPRRTSEEE